MTDDDHDDVATGMANRPSPAPPSPRIDYRRLRAENARRHAQRFGKCYLNGRPRWTFSRLRKRPMKPYPILSEKHLNRLVSWAAILPDDKDYVSTYDEVGEFLVLARVEKGAITGWHITGPMSLDEAMVMTLQAGAHPVDLTDPPAHESRAN